MREINAGALAGLIPCVVHDVLCRGHRVFGLAPPNRRHETFHGAPIWKRYGRGGAFRRLKFGVFSPRLFGYRHLRVPRSLDLLRISESKDLPRLSSWSRFSRQSPIAFAHGYLLSVWRSCHRTPGGTLSVPRHARPTRGSSTSIWRVPGSTSFCDGASVLGVDRGFFHLGSRGISTLGWAGGGTAPGDREGLPFLATIIQSAQEVRNLRGKPAALCPSGTAEDGKR